MTKELATAEFDHLEEQVATWMAAQKALTTPEAEPSEAAFDKLARAVFRFQFHFNQPYQAWCRSLGVDDPGAIVDWQTIPALPADAFKHQGRALTVLPEQEAEACFRTSGTTRDRSQRGEHRMARLKLYEQSIRDAWSEAALPRLTPLFLTPSPEITPDSSLAHMTGVLARFLPVSEREERGRAAWLLHPDEDGSQLLTRLRDALATGQAEPRLLFGTALAFRHLLDAIGEERLPLPPGSALMETGGYKNRQDLALDKDVFYQSLRQTFDLELGAIWNEYSMTELSSQTYTRGLGRPHRCPPWLRVRVLDPETHLPATPEQPGYLEFVDLANLGSCLAIRTADLALPVAGSRGREFTLLGRDPSALPRGCSRSADEMLGSAHAKNPSPFDTA